MRSQYQPAVFSVPRTLSADDPSPAPFGGRCAGKTAGEVWRGTLSDGESPIDALLAPLLERARKPGSRLHYSPVGDFHCGDCRYSLPRFVFKGPRGGGNVVRLGIFAAIHGDEPETAAATGEFLRCLDADPSLAQGYDIYVYPACNPSGLEDGTRHSRAGLDLNREFWRGSAQPEVYFLERELGVQQFAGLIALHADDTSKGAYAFVRGATLTEALAKPALAAAAEFLPLADGKIIDGFPAREGLISQCYEGVLSNPAEMKPEPFEIIFETPQMAPFEKQTAGAAAALLAILGEYRKLLAYGQDL